MKLAFIGLGVMGAPMARHLAVDHDLAVFDVDRSRLEGLDDSGARLASGVNDAGSGAECVLLSLPSSEIVRAVATGGDGLLDALAPGACVIDTSTTAPSVSREVARALAGKGIDFMDCPVSGGEGGAKAATLSIMAGGRSEVFERFGPMLHTLGTTVTLLGDVGTGGVAKLVNNMIVGVTFASIAEGFALGRENGLDLGVLYQAIRGGWAGSAVLDVAGPGIIENDFEPGGTVDIHFKDMGYALDLAGELNVPTPMTALAQEIFKAARSSGRGAKAQHSIYQLWESLAPDS